MNFGLSLQLAEAELKWMARISKLNAVAFKQLTKIKNQMALATYQK